jgi:hypothetical protein
MNYLKIVFIALVTFFSSMRVSSQTSIGPSFSTYYNFKTLHYAPSVNVQFDNHAVYIGPDVVSVLKPLGDPVNSYEKNAVGVQFGYNYTFFTKNKFSLLCDFHFSMYNYQTITYTWFTMTPSNRLIIENSFAFAANYQFTKGLSVYAGAGINSYDGFFLLLEHSSATCFAGMKYQFALNGKAKE